MAKTEKKKKSFLKRVFKILFILMVFAVGVLVGIHWRVFRALIRGEELPKMPENHIACPLCKLKKFPWA